METIGAGVALQIAIHVLTTQIVRYVMMAIMLIKMIYAAHAHKFVRIVR